MTAGVVTAGVVAAGVVAAGVVAAGGVPVPAAACAAPWRAARHRARPSPQARPSPPARPKRETRQRETLENMRDCTRNPRRTRQFADLLDARSQICWLRARATVG